jgi:hypothetical protein
VSSIRARRCGAESLISVKQACEAFIFNHANSSNLMNKKLLIVIIAIIVIVGLSAAVIAVNPSNTILPIPPPIELHKRIGNSSSLRERIPQ